MKHVRGMKLTILFVALSACVSASGTTENDDKALMDLGRKTFVAKCAPCHNETGDKPLADGPPLNERKLSPEKLAKGVKGRLGGESEDTVKGTILYVQGFMKR